MQFSCPVEQRSFCGPINSPLGLLFALVGSSSQRFERLGHLDAHRYQLDSLALNVEAYN